MNNYNSSIQHIIGKKYSLVSGIITDQEIDSLKKSINNLSLKQQSKIIDKFKYIQKLNSDDDNNNLDEKKSMLSLQISQPTSDILDLSSKSPQASQISFFQNAK
ncbi:13467_t:CDS:2 [Entrophospora sp. SA101]|nr:13467_t:CDS:2 [Entrophospora sp. SA101]